MAFSEGLISVIAVLSYDRRNRVFTMPLRLAVFSSHYAGLAVADRLLSEADDRWEVCMIASDDPFNKICNPDNRVWQYGNERDWLPSKMKQFAARHGLEVEFGSINSDEFLAQVFEKKIDAIQMCIFGQKVRSRLRNAVQNQVWNIRPTSLRPWPSCIGTSPFEQMIGTEKEFRMMLHVADETMDQGPEVMASPAAPIETGDEIMELHRRAAPIAAQLAVDHLNVIAQNVKLQSQQ